jgi:photosystem II stability/assembly factor-like uncharacterized protein
MRTEILFLCILIVSVSGFPQWSRTSGPEGVSISNLANIEGTIYAGTTVDGLYYSTDDGLNWMPLNAGIETFEVTSVAAKTGYLFVGTLGYGVYRSTDDGQTWMAPVTGGDFAVSSIVVKDSFIFAGTYDNGVYRSADNGATWTESFPGFLISILAMCVNGNTIYASSYGMTYASTDNGDNWQEVPDLTTSFIYSFYCSGDTIIGGAVNEIYRSMDGGSTFTQIPIPFPSDVVNTYSIVALDSTLYMATSFYGVYRSTDNGSTWSPANIGMGPKDVRALVAIDSSTLVAGTHYVGVFRSINGGENWNKSMAGFLKGSTIATMISSGAIIFAGTRNDGMYRTIDNGATWIKLSSTNDTINYAAVQGMCEKDEIIYAGPRFHFSSTVYKSEDKGITWARSGSGLADDLAIVYGMAISGDNILAATDKGLYYSANDGESWQLTNLFYSDIRDVAAGENNYVYAIVPGVGIYKSTNNGIDWILSYPSLVDFINLSAIDNYAYAGTFFEGSFYTINFGNTWPHSAGFPDNTSIFATQHVSNGLVLAGTSIEPFWIYASFNDGVSFSPYSEGLAHHTPVEAFAVNDSFMFAGTDYNAVWRRLRPGVVNVKTPINTPQKFQLSQNFPNPFNPITTIQYVLTERAKVTLKIYDVLGNEIRTLVDETQSAGTHLQQWDGSGLPSGVYFYRLEGGPFVQTRKLLLLK